MTSPAILSAFMAAMFGSPTLTPDVNVEDGPHGSGRYAAVAKRLGVRVVEARGPEDRVGGTVRWTAAPPERYAGVARHVAIQLDHFPVSLVKAAGWRELILCHGLTLDGKAAGGLAYDGTIWLSLDVGGPLGLYHEFFHVLEKGLVRSGWICDQDLADWEAITREVGNLPGKTPAGRLDAIDRWRWTKEASRGFISAYAASAPVEDRAEVFAHLIFLPNTSAQRAAADRPCAGRSIGSATSSARPAPTSPPISGRTPTPTWPPTTVEGEPPRTHPRALGMAPKAESCPGRPRPRPSRRGRVGVQRARVVTVRMAPSRAARTLRTSRRSAPAWATTQARSAGRSVT